MRKLFLCAIISALLMAFSVNVYADGLAIENDELVIIKEKSKSNQIVEYENMVTKNSDIMLFSIEEWQPDESDFKEYYYDQLPQVEQYIYDYINENHESILNNTGIFMIELPESLYYIYNQSDIIPERPIYVFFNYDHAEQFGYNFATLSISTSGFYTDTTQTEILITSVGFYFGGKNATTALLGYNSITDLQAAQLVMENNVQAIINSIPKNASRKLKLQIINDWLVDNNAYNPNITENDYSSASSVAWMISSALVHGNGDDDTKYPVCEGYAEAFKYLCDRVEIPCISVISNTHKWNAVQMDDGNWYFVDVTWNDPLGNTPEIADIYRYRYFLVGTSAFASDSSHVLSVEEELLLTTPDISSTNYVYAHNGDINGDLLIDNEDVAVMLKYISQHQLVSDDEITRGDINNDGEITLLDAILTLQTINN